MRTILHPTAAAIGAAAGQGRLLVAGVATALSLFVLEIRHIRVLSMLDGRRWSRYFPNDEDPVNPVKPPEDQQPGKGAQGRS